MMRAREFQMRNPKMGQGAYGSDSLESALNILLPSSVEEPPYLT